MIIDQSRTITHGFQVGPDYRWSPSFDTFLRYKFQNADQPLIGFKQDNGVINTLLPQHDHIVEIGFNWVPADWFILNACVGIETGDNHSRPTCRADPTIPHTINFDEQNYPMSFNAWYAASQTVVVLGGLRRLLQLRGAGHHHRRRPVPLLGSSSIAAGYRALELRRASPRRNPRLPLRGHRAADAHRTGGMGAGPRPDHQLGDALPGDRRQRHDHRPGQLSREVLNETTRLSLGADWMLRPRVVTYVRYELYNFRDIAPGYQTGLAQGILGGFSAMF